MRSESRKNSCLFVEPGRIGDWVLSEAMVNNYCRKSETNPVWVVREELKELVVEQYGPAALGGLIPSTFSVIDLPKYLWNMFWLRCRCNKICIVSPGKSATLAMYYFCKRHRFGYVSASDAGECRGLDGVWRDYDVNKNHLHQRAAYIFDPQVVSPPRLRDMQSAVKSILEILSNNNVSKNFVLFSSGARWKYRRWTQKGWAELAERLIANGVSVVLCGTPEEKKKLQELKNEIDSRRCILMPSLSIPEFVELCRLASCMVALDSGPMHIAAAVKTPCVVIYGPSDPSLTLGLAGQSMMRVVRSDGCPYWPCITPANSNDGGGCAQGEHVCMNGVSAEDVYSKVLGVLNAEF